MPLFFIVSGFFYKPQPVAVQVKKAFKSLIVPYLFTAGGMVAWGLFDDLYGNELTFPNETVRWFRICFYGSYNPDTPLGNFIGPVWFLLALFWCRVVFSFFFSDDKRRDVICFIVIPVFVSYMFKFVYVPLYVLQGITALIFYYAGHLLKKYDVLNKKLPIPAVLGMLTVWIYCVFFSHIDMHNGYYDNFIINVAGALSGFYFVYRFAMFIGRLNVLNRLLAYVGRLSLVALCFHSLDFSINPFGVLITMIQSDGFMQGHFFRYYIGIRYLYIFIVLLIVPKIKALRQVFLIK
jgi:fucose 4-O-acetylase-like acetyltransferase